MELTEVAKTLQKQFSFLYYNGNKKQKIFSTTLLFFPNTANVIVYKKHSVVNC